jgi:hypothetical protein
MDQSWHAWTAGGTSATWQRDTCGCTGDPSSYGLRPPAIEEKRVLFICSVDGIATFGKA